MCKTLAFLIKGVSYMLRCCILLLILLISNLLSGPTEAPINPLLSTPSLNKLNQLVVCHVAAQWNPLGLSLGVEPGALAIINANHPHDVEGACRDLFLRWLARGPGTGEQPRVWQSVLSAVRETVGETVAREIERSFLSTSSPLELNQDNCGSE